MKKDDSVYLRHILDAVRRISEYTKDATYESFAASHLIQDGVIRQIEIIGEASKSLSQTFREKNSHIPWKAIVGMRDKMIHDYLGVNIESVWKTAKEDIPMLEKEIRKILAK